MHFKLEQRLYFKWMQLLNVIPSNWKNNLKHSNIYSQNLILLDHNLVKSNSLFNIEMLDPRELYCIINSSRNNKPTSQIYFLKKFDSKELNWRIIYTLPRKVTTNTHLRSFQYKILSNILYLNERLFVIGLSTTPFCSFCNSFGENMTHLFCDCITTQCLWKKLQLKLNDNITLHPLTPQMVIFSFFEANCQSNLIQNYILFISKLYVYKFRKSKFLSSTCLLKQISKIKNIEKKVASANEKKTSRKRKWGIIEDKLPSRGDNTVT